MEDNFCNKLSVMASIFGAAVGTSLVLFIAMLYLNGNKSLLCLFYCLPCIDKQYTKRIEQLDDQVSAGDSYLSRLTRAGDQVFEQRGGQLWLHSLGTPVFIPEPPGDYVLIL